MFENSKSIGNESFNLTEIRFNGMPFVFEFKQIMFRIFNHKNCYNKSLG